ncbi:MAG: BrxA/BrxB family bacilliredoxin [Gemmatimonadota bacterium]|nr:BrxA/BrxB family bacilliredoxin [Gemmatimonadota bacterium]
MQMRYDPQLVQPMRDELTQLGFRELRTPEDVDQMLGARDETVLLVVNSVCGCAAGKARPGVALALRHTLRPDRLTTVFAGMDLDATARARQYFEGYPPSSPQIALLKNGRLLHMLERKDIEGREAPAIAGDLVAAFETFCGQPAR